MNPHYHPELAIVVFFFDIALLVYLNSIRSEGYQIRMSFLHFLYGTVFVCILDVARAFVMNSFRNVAVPEPAGLANFAAGTVLKLLLLLLFILYMADVFRNLLNPSTKLALTLSTILIIAALVLNFTLMPHMLIITFASSVVAFLNYFIVETPAYVQLEKRLVQLEEARKKAEENRRRAIEEDAAMNDFLANMSHEIRTPLTAILGYNEVILSDAREEDVVDYAEDIQRAGNTLLYIVNDILDFSRIESGEMKLEVKEYHLSDVLDNIDNMIRKKASDKGLEYRTRINDSIPERLKGDGIRINQILLNLMNNAVKYTLRGFVELSLDMEETGERDRIILRFAVTDSGVGIREEDLPELFSSFSRFDEHRLKNIEGTGLGLAITARLVELMDGKLDVESTYGEGSTFTVTIPQEVLGIRTLREYSDGSLSDIHVVAADVVAPDARILVVDDNLTNRTVVAELLRRTMVKIDMAESGAECLERVREQEYDLILLDQMMPNMSGPETLKHMEGMKDNLSKGAPVIAFTADAIAGTRERLLAAGFDDYLSKPVTGADLTNLLIDYLPHEKMMLPGDVGYENARAAQEAAAEKHMKSADQTALEELEGIDLTHALAMCGTKDVLLAAVRDFRHTITSQADLMEKYLKEEDIKNYTIKVHALKSAANFIGAKRLSEDAAYLERCGNEGRTDEINLKSPKLLADYRSYLDKLAAVEEEVDPENDDREEIPSEDLHDAYNEIRMFAEEYNFDGVDSVMAALSDYRIPEAEREMFDKLSQLVTNVDREGILECVNGDGSL